MTDLQILIVKARVETASEASQVLASVLDSFGLAMDSLAEPAAEAGDAAEAGGDAGAPEEAGAPKPGWSAERRAKFAATAAAKRKAAQAGAVPRDRDTDPAPLNPFRVGRGVAGAREPDPVGAPKYR